MIDHVGLGVSDLERSGVSQIGRPASFHPGDNPGYQSFSASIPDADTSIVVLLNDDAPNLWLIVNTLARTVLA